MNLKLAVLKTLCLTGTSVSIDANSTVFRIRFGSNYQSNTTIIPLIYVPIQARCVKNTDIECMIFVLETTSSSKIRALERLGASIRRHGTDCLDTEMFAKEFAKVK